MLKVKKLDPRAVLPTVAHPGEDLGYDLYALEETVLRYGEVTKVRTGISAQSCNESYLAQVLSREPNYEIPPVVTPLGLLIRDRSSMASKGIVISGGVIDYGYTGEIVVLMTNWGSTSTVYLLDRSATVREVNIKPGQVLNTDFPKQTLSYKEYVIKAGDKIAQMVPVPVLTGQIVEVEELTGQRGEAGFGSTGK